MLFVALERDIDPGIGCRKLWLIFCNTEWKISRGLFEDVLRSNHLMKRIRKRSTRTTYSLHGLPTFPNLIYSVIPDHPCHVWVADITYVRLVNADGSTRFCYLSIILDAYSRYIFGWYVGRTLETIHSLIALNMALENAARLKIDLTGLIHHSDRGVQYASAEYVSVLMENHVSISMTQNGNPKDNPQAERVNCTVKNELLNDQEFTSIEEVRALLNKKIPYYNERRPHMSINNLTPLKALSHKGPLKKLWRSYRDEAIQKESAGKSSVEGFSSGVANLDVVQENGTTNEAYRPTNHT